MSNSTFQSLLMESGGSLPPPEPACEYDPYYNTGPVNDSYWADVVTLLHFDGSLTDSSSVGATFADYSTSFNTANARFIQSLATTLNTTQGLASPLSLNYDLNSTDFTLELWVCVTNTPAADRVILGIYDSGGVAEYTIVVTSSRALKFYYPNGVATQLSITASITPLNFWTHIAVTRENNTYRVFFDGREHPTTATSTYRRTVATKYLYIGNGSPGVGATAAGALYDEVRVTNGVARYVANFAFDNNPFPNALETEWSPSDPRTVLSLTAEPLRLQDYIMAVPGTANANDTVTYNGELITPVINDATAVSYDSNGITFVADNSNNYITYTGSKVIPLNYYDIIEYKATVSYTGTLSGTGGPVIFIRVGTTTTYCGLAYTVASGVLQLYVYYRTPTTSDFTYSDVAIPALADFAIRFNKKAQTITWLMNDQVISQSGTPATSAGTSVWPTAGFRLGPEAAATRGGITAITIKDCTINAYYLEDNSGYLPQLLYSSRNTYTTQEEKKFGQYSYRSWNTGSASTSRKYSFGVTNEFDFGTGDFTLDLWAYRLDNTYLGRIFTGSNAGSMYAEVTTGGQLNVSWLSSGGIQFRSSLTTITTNEWHHFAFQRRGTLFEVYVDGTLVDSISITGGASSTTEFTFLSMGSSLYLTSDTTHYNGYLDAVRLLKGAARYSGNFTPSDLPTCDDSDPGTVIPTSGRDYPRGEAATVQTGQITLANHYQPLSGQRVFVDQGGVGLIQYPLPSGNTATYTVTKTLTSSAATTTTVTGTLTWGTDGTFTFVNPENRVGTTWLSPTGAGASDEYEFRLEIIDNPNNVVTPYALPFEQYNEVVIDQIIPAYTDITLTEDEGSKIHTLQLQVDIKPKAGSAVAGKPGYVDSWLLTLNFLLTKPAIVVPVYPDFDSGTKINSESGNVFTWYFNPNGTITSGVINGTQIGRWIDAFDEVDKAEEYRLVIYSDPLPGGFQRVSPTTLIGANMGTSARVKYFNSGFLGSDLYVGFTLRIYPLPTNPRYNEANYFGQYTFTMVIPQISGF